MAQGSRNKDKNNGGNEAPVELVLGGQALRVYLELLLSKEPLGVRELQRRLGFKSPSSAKHHLDRLVRLGLVAKTFDGRYRAVESKTSILSAYTMIAGSFVPRVIPVAAGLLAGIVAYIAVSFPYTDWIPVGLALVGDIFLWIEGIRMLRYFKRLVKTKRVKGSGL